MSRVAKCPITVPNGVSVNIEAAIFTIKGSHDSLQYNIPSLVRVQLREKALHIVPCDSSRTANVLAGTTRAHLNNCVIGVSKGFECLLLLVGVGYRAQLQGRKLCLTIGYSHPVVYSSPDGVMVEILEPTKIMLKGPDKQKVYQTAAEIRHYRPPEPYKGKGIRYANEKILLKETKKK